MKNETLTVGQNPLPLLSYDGEMGLGYYQFTEYDQTAPSYRASFYLEVESFTSEKLAAKRASKAEEFSRCAML